MFKKQITSMLLALSMVMGLSVSAFAVEQEPTHVYYKPIQVDENTWEYRDEDGSLVATLEAFTEIPEVATQARASDNGPWTVDWQLSAQSSKYDQSRTIKSDGTITLYVSVQPSNSGKTYIGYYMHEPNRYSWLETPYTSTAVISRKITIGTNTSISFAIQNAGTTSNRYIGRYGTAPF